MASLRHVVREPLVQFLVFGALLFGFFQCAGSFSGPGSRRIVITPGLVEHLASGFARTGQRPPTDTELKGLVDDHVKEEIATREAVGMGLDRDDTIIRRRLRQKFEFLAEDAVNEAAPTGVELQAWLDAHADAFRTEPQLSFRQVYLSPDRRGERARADAERALVGLRAAGPEAAIDRLGDPSMLPSEQPLEPLREVSRTFGEDFAGRLLAIEPGQWAGPVESPYGWHLILVRERVAASAPGLDLVRPLVERELMAERRRTGLDALYRRLIEKYAVTIEMPEAAAGEQGGAR